MTDKIAPETHNDIEEVKPGLFVKYITPKKVLFFHRKGGYYQVYPVVKDINKPFGKGNINWKNFLIGGGNNWMFLIIALIAILALFAYKHDTNAYAKIIENPCITSCASQCININYNQLNLSRLNITQNERGRFIKNKTI